MDFETKSEVSTSNEESKSPLFRSAKSEMVTRAHKVKKINCKECLNSGQTRDAVKVCLSEKPGVPVCLHHYNNSHSSCPEDPIRLERIQDMDFQLQLNENLLNLMNCYFNILVPSSSVDLQNLKKKAAVQMTALQREAYEDLQFRWDEFRQYSRDFDKVYEERNWDKLASIYNELNDNYIAFTSSRCVQILSIEHSKIKAMEATEDRSEIEYTCLEAKLAEAIGAKNRYDELAWITNRLEGELLQKNDEITHRKAQVKYYKALNAELGEQVKNAQTLQQEEVEKVSKAKDNEISAAQEETKAKVIEINEKVGELATQKAALDKATIESKDKGIKITQLENDVKEEQKKVVAETAKFTKANKLATNETKAKKAVYTEMATETHNFIKQLVDAGQNPNLTHKLLQMLISKDFDTKAPIDANYVLDLDCSVPENLALFAILSKSQIPPIAEVKITGVTQEAVEFKATVETFRTANKLVIVNSQIKDLATQLVFTVAPTDALKNITLKSCRDNSGAALSALAAGAAPTIPITFE